MPWVNVVISKACSKGDQEQIKSGAARLLREVFGKGEQGLTVTFQVAEGFFRAGEASSDSAVVEIRYIGQFPLAKKQEITRRVCDLLNQVLQLTAQKVIVLFSEFSSENWGRKAGDFQ